MQWGPCYRCVHRLCTALFAGSLRFVTLSFTALVQGSDRINASARAQSVVNNVIGPTRGEGVIQCVAYVQARTGLFKRMFLKMITHFKHAWCIKYIRQYTGSFS